LYGPEFGVEIGQGLIKEEDFGLADNGPAQGDPLPLPPGEGFRFPVEKMVDIKDMGGFLNPLLNLHPGKFPHFQTEGHVVENRHMGVESIILKDHGNIPVLGMNVIDFHPVNKELSL